MKPLLKILIPLFFVAAIGLFVAFKSGVFDNEQPAAQPLKERKQEQAVNPKTKTEAPKKDSSAAKEFPTPRPKPRTLKVEEQAETTQNVNPTPVVMPSSKSVIMVNPTIDKKSIFDGNKASSKQAPGKQKVMPSSKSGVIIHP